MVTSNKEQNEEYKKDKKDNRMKEPCAKGGETEKRGFLKEDLALISISSEKIKTVESKEKVAEDVVEDKKIIDGVVAVDGGKEIEDAAGDRKEEFSLERY